MIECYMLVGVPASGKSFVAEQCKDRFTYVHHDLFIGMAGDAYVRAILTAARSATKPLLTEAPFSVSQIKEPLERAGIKVTPIVILGNERDLHERWDKRGNVAPATRKGHLTRQKTYADRAAREWGAFKGTSAEVLVRLNQLVPA